MTSGPTPDTPDTPTRPPRPVLLAASVIAVEGLAGIVGGIVGVVAGGLATLDVWGFVVLLGLGFGGAGVALVRGVRGARGPAVVSQLLLLGVAFYAAVPSGQPGWGVPLALLAAGVLMGLLGREGREWVDRTDPPPED